MKYTYPIVISHEPDASTKAPQYIVRIPDFDALTQGESITDAIEMGQDLLSILVVQYEDEKRELPEVSSFTGLSERFSGSVVSLVIADSDHYRQMYQSKPVKKHLRFRLGLIPEPRKQELISPKHCKMHSKRNCCREDRLNRLRNISIFT